MELSNYILRKKIILINKDRKLGDLLKKLNHSEIKTCFILNKKKLIGSITDGDLRRAIYQDISINTKVENICNKNPKIIFDKEKNFDLKMKFYYDKFKISIIPVVNKKKEYLGFLNYEDLNREIETSFNKFDVIIMAGGYGKRLRPITNKIPKPLVPINNVPIISRIIDNLVSNQINNIFITLHYKSTLIIKYIKKNYPNKKIIFVNEKKPLDTAGSLLNLKNKIIDNVLVINSDIITNINISNFYEYHAKIKSDITICSKKYKIILPYGVLKVRKNNVMSITEKPKFEYWINTGIYFIKSNIFNKLKTNRKLDAIELIQSSKKIGLKVIHYPIYETWFDIGNIEDMKAAEKHMKKKINQ